MRARTVPFKFKELVKEELKRLQSCGIIEKVDYSEFASPIVPVLKSNGEIRLCADFSKTINTCTVLLTFPMPTVDHVLGSLGRSKIFSKTDLQNAYLQLPLDDNAKKLCVINTTEGLFKYNYLPFGVSSSPAIFQRFMYNLLCDLKGCIVYQDDILLLSEPEDEHVILLDKVLSRLMEAGVKVNHKKSTYFTDKVKYLGYMFSKDGTRPCTDNIKAITECPSPTNLKELQSFIGLCNYYSRFLPNFSQLFAPLYKLLVKNAVFKWSEVENKCFSDIKIKFKNANIKNFDASYPIALFTDASPQGIGAVLKQYQEGRWQPISFASRSLNSAERNYSQLDKEALGVYYGCNKFREYLLGSNFVIKTDHRPLLKLLGPNQEIPANVSPIIQRYALRLSNFNYTIEHIKGSLNVQSDCLSRLPLSSTEEIREPNEIILNIAKTYHILGHSDIREETDKDDVLKQVKKYIQRGTWPKKYLVN